MAIKERTTKGGLKKYDVIYYVGNKQQSKTFDRRIDAKTFENGVKTDKVRGLLRIPVKKTVLFSTFADEWLNNHSKLSKAYKSYINDVSRYRNHILPFFKNYRLENINSGTIKDYVAYRQSKLDRRGNIPKPATINKDLEILSKIFTDAVDRELLDKKPKIQKLKVPETPIEWLKEDEIRKFLDATEEEYLPMFAFAVYTGMRLGELINLRKSDVDVENSRITVAVGNADTNTTKSKKPRHIPINENLFSHIEKAFMTPGEYMFPNKFGERRCDVGKAFERALEKAGIERHIRFHDLRHTFASHFAMKSGNLLALKEILGHSDLKMVLRYAHLASEHLDEQINKLSF